MSDSAAGTDLTAFGPVSTVEEDRLGQYYAYPENLTSCWVRANFISSLDGAATADGRSGALGGAGDRAVFRLMRELADVVGAVAAADADGEISANELKSIQLQWAELVGSVQQLMLALEAKHEATMAKWVARQGGAA